MNKYRQLFIDPIVRRLTVALLINGIGSSLYGIVLLIMARQLPQHSIAITLISVGSMIPALLQIIPAKLAAKQPNKYHSLIISRWMQGGFFILVAIIANQINWVIYIVILIINLISSAFSMYNISLTFVVEKRYIKGNLLRELSGINNVISTLISLGGQSIGISILAFAHNDFRLVAIINAITFFLSAAILQMGGKKVIAQKEADIKRQAEQLKNQRNSDLKTSSKKSNSVQPVNLRTVFTKVTQLPFNIGLPAILIINVVGAGFIPLLDLVLADQNIISNNYGWSLLLFSIVTNTGFIMGSLLNFKCLDQIKRLMWIIEVIMVVYILNLLFLKNGLLLLGLEFGLDFILAKVAPLLMSRTMQLTSERKLPVIIAKLETIFTIADPIGTLLFPIAYITLGFNVAFLILLAIVIISLLVTVIGINIYHLRTTLDI